jgi:tRNA G37 N-methylase TrmD
MEANMNQMDLFLHHANIENFRKQLANTTDRVRRQTLLELLASEEDKNKLLPDKTA